MLVAVFGDVHGALDGMYEVARRWSGESGLAIDLVLQCGDLGAFRSADPNDEAAADRATRRRLERDPTELGAVPYLNGDRTAPFETWFIHGNHDPFRMLARFVDRPIDPAGRIRYLGSGAVHEFRAADTVLRIAALGGMEYRFGKVAPPVDEPVAKYIHGASLERLHHTPGRADVLLLHEAPFNKGLHDRFPTGSKRITALIEALAPRLVFYGHYDRPPEPFRMGESFCVPMNSDRALRVPGRDGAMGILRWPEGTFAYVPKA